MPDFDVQRLDAARTVAAALDARVSRPTVPVRSAFIVAGSADSPPPMTLLLRGGRGGEVKLKLLLSMLWVAVAKPYDVTQPARVWAELIGLTEPESKGAARVNAAIRRLVEAGYLVAERRGGHPSRLILRNETGTGEQYTHPGSHWDSKAGKPPKDTPRYTRLPSDLWVQGWIARLSGPAIAVLLLLLEQTRGKNFEELWFSPSVAARRYGLSEATRRKGVDELVALGVIVVDRMPVGRGSLSVIRQRNTYTINMPRLKEKPEDEPAALVIVRNAAARADRARQSTESLMSNLADMGKGEGAKELSAGRPESVRKTAKRSA